MIYPIVAQLNLHLDGSNHFFLYIRNELKQMLVNVISVTKGKSQKVQYNLIEWYLSFKFYLRSSH